ncbi:aldo/keto reductase [Candidatus Nomurabacteria bacterium]|nr:aldo/keto reductase [Candidatus Nomurabacteria bacterium]MCB9819421.1 aldo/keto reductase [Candidatus Nomurabacteria bacterium]
MNKKIKFKNGVECPALGFGTWQLQGEEAERAVKEAIEVGYRHIDTADRYGNHLEVGKAINESGIERSDLFLTTKLWDEDLSGVRVALAVDRFLQELNTEYIDLLLIHWPNQSIPIEETLIAMKACQDTGKVRSVGVSNFTEHHLEDALATGIEFVTNQVEVRPHFNQVALREYCTKNNIVVTGYSSLRAGDMAEPVIVELAEKYRKSPAQIILNWVVSRGMIALPQSTKVERMKENLESLDFSLSKEDLSLIDSVPQEERYNNPSFAEFSY